jgi:hypothetical protein
MSFHHVRIMFAASTLLPAVDGHLTCGVTAVCLHQEQVAASSSGWGHSKPAPFILQHTYWLNTCAASHVVSHRSHLM